MSNIIDKIQLSGVTYDLPSGGSGSTTVELTQAEYDSLVSAGTVNPNTYYIISDASPADMSNYWTSAQTNSAITAAISGKVDTSSVVTAVTSGSTDSEIPTAKAVFDAIPTGGTSITIDPTLDSGSTNPVANSAITAAIANATDGRLKEDLVFSGNCGYGTIHSNVGIVSDEYLIINTYPSTKISFSGYRSRNENYKYEIVIQDIATKDTYRAYYYVNYNTLQSSGGTGVNYASIIVSDGIIKFTVIDGYRIIGLVRDMPSGREHYNFRGTYNANIPSGTTLSELFVYITNVNANLKGLTKSSFYTLNTQHFTDEYGGELYYQQTVFPTNGSFTAHTSNTTMHTTQAEKDSWNGKIDASAITSSITSGSTDSEIPTAKAVYDAIPTGGTGGGKAISAGTNISVTTGETADTVSCTLPITANSSNIKSISIGGQNTISNQCDASIVVGYRCSLNDLGADGAAAIGWYCNANKDFSFAQGNFVNANNQSEHSVGQYNVSNTGSTTFGNSGNTLFSVGNGTADNARHNAFEIRQNGDIYITSGGTDIKLQDNLGGGISSGEVQTMIDEAVSGYVSIASNVVSGFTIESNLDKKAGYTYADAFNGPLIFRIQNTSSSNITLANCYIWTSSTESTNIYLQAGVLNGVITADTSAQNDYVTTSIVDGGLVATLNEGYYWKDIFTFNTSVVYALTNYSSGQSKNVIEDTVYPILTKSNKDVLDLKGNSISSINLDVRNGYIGTIIEKGTSTINSFNTPLTSSTINYDSGLHVQFETDEPTQKILNTGKYNYCELFNYSTYDESFDDMTITMNESYSGQSTETLFTIYFISDSSTTLSSFVFNYNISNNSFSWFVSTPTDYVTVTDTLSTDYKLKFEAKEGYRIARFRSNDCSICGVDNTNPNNYISNLVTTTSYYHDGQDVIDDIVSGKVDTSAITSAMTNTSTDAQVPSAKCVYDQLGGLKLVKLTQSAYDALSPNYDSNTLYIIKD